MLQICIKICCKNKIRKNSLYLPNYKSASEFVAKIESEKTLQICINLLQNWNRKISLFLLCYKYASKFVAKIRAEEIPYFSYATNMHQNLLQNENIFPLMICIKCCCKIKIWKKSLFLLCYKSASKFVTKIKSEKISFFPSYWQCASNVVAKIESEKNSPFLL